MTIAKAAQISGALLLTCVGAFSEDTATILPSYRATRLAESAIRTARMPRDCYVRSTTLIQESGAAPYYCIHYKESASQPADGDSDKRFFTVDVIHVSMDGRVSFEQEKRKRRVRVINN